MTFRSFTLASVLVALTGGAVRAAQYDVYVAAGQSNMDGRGLASDLTGSLASYAGTQTDVKLYYDNPVAAVSYTPSWVSLRPGYSTPGDGSAVPSGDFGPEVAFGRAMQNAAAPGHTVAIVKVSEGGTNLVSDWNPNATTGKQLFKLMVADVQAAMAGLGGPGDTVTLRGMIWHQGESDSGNTSQASYATRLTNFINATRTSLFAPNLPFVVGQIELNNHGTNIPNAQVQVGTQSGFYTGLARSDNLTLGDGTTHFDAQGQILLGQRFAVAMQGIVPEPAGAGLIVVGAAVVGSRRTCRTRRRGATGVGGLSAISIRPFPATTGRVAAAGCICNGSRK